jgi:hypothetical protein
LAKLFGFEIKAGKEEKPSALALPEPKLSDGALEMLPFGQSYNWGTSFDFDPPQDEIKLVTKYREVSLQPEFQKAIDDVINEAFDYGEKNTPVVLNLDNLPDEVSKSTKEKILEEYETVLRLLNFKQDAYQIFRRWYIDGRLYYQKIIDVANPSKGLTELRYVDPRRIRKIRQRKKSKNNQSDQSIQTVGVEVGVDYDEFYLYNPMGISPVNPQGIPITLDSISYIHSGLFSVDNKTVLSHLHQAIRWFNCLRQLEDSVVIYRLVRAPERRVFNVEVGDLPPRIAEQHVDQAIKKFRKKLSFDPSTGEVAEQKRFMTMQEDFWFPKRNGEGTEVTQLPGGQSLGQMDDVDYFKRKLYEALGVPISRLDPTSTWNAGRSSEITRDELKFTKFVNRLQLRFNGLFDDLLRAQLLLKKIIKEPEWKIIQPNLHYDYQQDNFFSELKWSEIFQNRFNMLENGSQFVGKFFTIRWIQENVLRMSEEEIDEMNREMDEERSSGIYQVTGLEQPLEMPPEDPPPAGPPR